MKLEGSFPHSQNPDTRPYPEPHASSPQTTPILFIWDSF